MSFAGRRRPPMLRALFSTPRSNRKIKNLAPAKRIVPERAQNSQTPIAVGMTRTYTQLVTAAWGNSLEEVKRLINQGADVNKKMKDGMTVLMYPSAKGYKEMVSVLIKAGANINAKSAKGMTALMWALCNEHTKTAKLLKTALRLASWHGHARTAKLLKKFGAR